MNGEHGLYDICMVSPTIIGRKDVESIVDFKLDVKEKSMLDDSTMFI